MKNNENIAAIATPPGKGGIGVVRVSGENLKMLAKSILGFMPKKRYVHYGVFYDAKAQIIDQGIALYFEAPYSYTGEDVLELHGHGSPVLLNLLLSRCIELGARFAHPGEFTLRAFLNGKIDLIQAESVADIINATTSQAALCAIKSLQGVFSKKIHELVAALIELRVFIEATLDFPEEDAIDIQSPSLSDKLSELCAILQQLLYSSQQGKLIQDGVQVVLVGAPNVGKSSLMNQLVEEDIAIVTEIPGTTRDAIQQTIQIDGVPLHVTDTAGLRETRDLIEKSGIARTYAAIQKADILLYVKDGSNLGDMSESPCLDLLPSNLPRFTIYNKLDLVKERPAINDDLDNPTIWLSAKTGEGLPLFREKILAFIGRKFMQTEESVFVARQRHLNALFDANMHLQNALSLALGTSQLDIIAEELRLTQQSLAGITGEYTSDDLLGEIFSSFCIGK